MVKFNTHTWKHTWYSNDDENGGAMQTCIAACRKEEITVHSHTDQYPRLYTNVTPKQLLKLLETNKGIFEVLTSYPRKVYFDIDCSKEELGDKEFASRFNNHKQYLADCCSIITEMFPDASIAVSGSITDTKISYHAVLQNYNIMNAEQLAIIKLVVTEMKTKETTFDNRVYTKNRNMKSVNQSKRRDTRIQLILKNNNIKDHLITCFFSDSPFAFPDFNHQPNVLEKIKIAKSNAPINILAEMPKLDKLKITEQQQSLINDYELADLSPLQLLTLMPLDKSFPHSHTWRMCRFAYFYNIPIEEFITWYSQKHADTASAAKYINIHFPNAYKYANPGIEQIRKIIIHFHPHFAKDVHYRKFLNSFDLPDAKIIKIDTISQQCFLSGHAIFNVGMGGGKTHQTIEYLRGAYAPPLTPYVKGGVRGELRSPGFIWICPNRALSHNTQKRLEDNHIPVAHYESFTKKQKDEGIFEQIDCLNIVANSLHYLGKGLKGTACSFLVVVIDEMETLLDKWEGSFMNNSGHKNESWLVFLNVVRNAKQLILLDAFITKKTLSFLHSLGIRDYKIYERKVEPITRHIYYYKSYTFMLKMIMDDLKQGKKIFIYYPYKNGTGIYPSMESLANVLECACNVKGVYYNADVDDKKKKQIKDVNFNWATINFVITNNVITCGVNYDNDESTEQFDNKYIFVISSTSPRDAIQVSYRARTLKENAIRVCFLGCMLQNNIWEDDGFSVMNNCPIYKALLDSIIMEKKSPLRKTLGLFCIKAHYVQHPAKKDNIADALSTEITELFEKYKIEYDFSLVEDISPYTADLIQQATIGFYATTLEKVQLKKYMFLANFKYASHALTIDDDIPFVQYMWNNNMMKLVDKIYEDADKPNSVFQIMQKEYKWKTIFPLHIDYKMKMKTDVKTCFFKEFKYKFCSMKTSIPHLLVVTYNSYFGKEIIETTYPEPNPETKKKNTHLSYRVYNEIWGPIYNFCIENRNVREEPEADAESITPPEEQEENELFKIE